MEHVVRIGESIEDILKKYQINLREFVSANPQVQSGCAMTPGTRLTIPKMNQQLEEEIEEIEPFLEDYYPRVNLDMIKAQINKETKSDIQGQTQGQTTGQTQGLTFGQTTGQTTGQTEYSEGYPQETQNTLETGNSKEDKEETNNKNEGKSFDKPNPPKDIPKHHSMMPIYSYPYYYPYSYYPYYGYPRRTPKK
jgi:uncharacterized protein (DUF433 family)